LSQKPLVLSQLSGRKGAPEHFPPGLTMRIHVINPNSSTAMTAKIAAAARAAAARETEIVATQSASAPASIESAHDEAFAVPGLLALVRDAERAGVGAHVIACFGDPGLRAAREIARAPVLGIAEAAMRAASMLASRFSIVTTLARTVGTAEQLVETYGLQRLCRRVRATEVAVHELEGTDDAVRRRIADECLRALAEDRAEAIVLGCAGMTDLCGELTRELGVPVIDGVGVAVKFAEALVGAGLATSKRGDFAHPPRKAFVGAIAEFAFVA
jgi:allantoin racemase